MTNEKLKRFRLLLGISTKEAAWRFGVAHRTWQTYEFGSRAIPGWVSEMMRHDVCKATPGILALLDVNPPISRNQYDLPS